MFVYLIMNRTVSNNLHQKLGQDFVILKLDKLDFSTLITAPVRFVRAERVVEEEKEEEIPVSDDDDGE